MTHITLPPIEVPFKPGQRVRWKDPEPETKIEGTVDGLHFFLEGAELRCIAATVLWDGEHRPDWFSHDEWESLEVIG